MSDHPLAASGDPSAMLKQLDEQRRKVDVDNLQMTVRELVGMAERGELHRAPEYQRKFRWDEEAESRLIESILLGLPVPNLFLATNLDGTLEIVDGLQRASTLLHFATQSTEQLAEIKKSENLTLTGLRKLSHFNGLRFDQLPSPVQLTFRNRGMGVTILSDKSDPTTRFDTFERLNRGAVELSPQEVRACIYDGPLNNLIRQLAADRQFTRLVKLQRRDQDNATHEELVLKFFAYLNNRESFRGAVSDFLNQYMEAHRRSFDVIAGRGEFEHVVSALSELIPGPFLRSNTHITPQNELEAVMVASAEVLRANGRLGAPSAGWLDDPELVRASTGATNTRRMLDQRIDRARTLLSPQ
jgi:hypothetical protein